ncbi:MAG: bifunctional 4-hydroxy-2-oxoglutarate aldolase/2-dehydro-3-deoxy-phosphogluconate aldolase [Spirochaetales bacterium]|nr:bifunctional 4-hydroxy-2-oxoglutarate aldolase/2-dehydro-3-deoxy-phosphogluconate aldolase [Spirochaetales bacterium]
MKDREIIQFIEKTKAIAILRSSSADHVKETAQAIIRGGLPLVEVSITTPGALDVIYALRLENPDAVIGAGTVNTVEDVRCVLEAGAMFVFSPVYNPEMINYCVQHNIVCIPGVFTPSEVFAATQQGAHFVKLFPASIGGPDYVKAIMAPLPKSRIIAVGGVTLDNLHAFYSAGALAVGIASCLFSKDDILAGNFTRISDNTKKFVAIVNSLS